MNIDYQIQLAKLLAAPDPTELGLPKMARVIALMLRDYEPCGREEVDIDDAFDSSDIVCTLDAIATVTINDVAETMSWLGFELVPTLERNHVWAMKYTGLRAIDAD